MAPKPKPKAKETRMTIWKLDKEIKLKDVINNLKLKYDLEISYLKDRNDISATDKTLQNGWLTGNDSGDFEIMEKEIANQKIKYVHAKGYYELAVGEARAINNGDINTGTVLDRHLRVSNRFCDATFFDLNGQVYVTVDVTESQQRNVYSILFGQGNKERKKEEWKKVENRDILQFNFDSKFFYWLLSGVGKTFSVSSDRDYKIELTDVHNVASLTEKSEYDSISNGSNILGSLPALSGLGSNQSVYGVGFGFRLPNMTLILRLADDSTCFINQGLSFVTNESKEMLGIENDKVTVSLAIYVILLLTLKQAFNIDTEKGKWTTKEESLQRKDYALYVIRELCEMNDLTLTDIKVIFTN